MSDFSFIGRCGNCENSNVHIDCTKGTCCLQIEHDDKKIECDNYSTIIECLQNPDRTFTNGIQDSQPQPNIITPYEVYTSMRNLVSACDNVSDDKCHPYSTNYFTNDPNDVSTGKCRNDSYTNYSLLTDPMHTQHPMLGVGFCDWLVSPMEGAGEPPIPGAGCYLKNVQNMNDDPASYNTCRTGFGRVIQCDTQDTITCCPIDKLDIPKKDGCDTGCETTYDVKNCRSMNVCKESCIQNPGSGLWGLFIAEDSGVCSCSTDADCNGSLNNSNEYKCVSGICQKAIPDTGGDIDNCYVYNETLGTGVECDTVWTGRGTACCGAGMECRTKDTNRLMMPANKNRWERSEMTDLQTNEPNRVGEGYCVATTNSQCEAVSTIQGQLYKMEADPKQYCMRTTTSGTCIEWTSRNLCVSEGQTRGEGCEYSVDEIHGKISGPPKLPGYFDGCESGVACSSSTFGNCLCDPNKPLSTQCSEGYVCEQLNNQYVCKTPNVTKCGSRPRTISDQNIFANDDSSYIDWTNEKCNYCDDLVEKGCKWSYNDNNCSRHPGTVKVNECIVEQKGLFNDMMLCCPSNIQQELTIQQPTFISANNKCSSFADFAYSPDKENKKKDFCGIYCPSKNNQQILVNNGIIPSESVCDIDYYNLCKQTGCDPDPQCVIKWGVEGRPSSLPSVVAYNEPIVSFYEIDKKSIPCDN